MIRLLKCILTASIQPSRVFIKVKLMSHTGWLYKKMHHVSVSLVSTNTNNVIKHKAIPKRPKQQTFSCCCWLKWVVSLIPEEVWCYSCFFCHGCGEIDTVRRHTWDIRPSQEQDRPEIEVCWLQNLLETHPEQEEQSSQSAFVKETNTLSHCA